MKNTQNTAATNTAAKNLAHVATALPTTASQRAWQIQQEARPISGQAPRAAGRIFFNLQTPIMANGKLQETITIFWCKESFSRDAIDLEAKASNLAAAFGNPEFLKENSAGDLAGTHVLRIDSIDHETLRGIVGQRTAIAFKGQRIGTKNDMPQYEWINIGHIYLSQAGNYVFVLRKIRNEEERQILVQKILAAADQYGKVYAKWRNRGLNQGVSKINQQLAQQHEAQQNAQEAVKAQQEVSVATTAVVETKEASIKKPSKARKPKVKVTECTTEIPVTEEVIATPSKRTRKTRTAN